MSETPNTRDDSGMDLSGGLTSREAVEMAAAADELEEANRSPVYFRTDAYPSREDFQYPKNTNSTHETRDFDHLVAYHYYLTPDGKGGYHQDVVPGSEVYADLGYCKRCGATPGLKNYTLTQKCAYAPE